MVHIAHESERVNVCCGDLLEVLPELPEACFDAVVTDPPYALNFMGKDWDSPYKMGGHVPQMTGGPMGGLSQDKGWHDEGYRNMKGSLGQYQQWCQRWAEECLRVLKPGGHMLVFGGTRTFHRLACAIEDAGFEIRDSISWLYGSGFPKSMDVSKAIDKAAGAEREVVGSVPSRMPMAQATGWGNPGVDTFRDERKGTVEMPITASATEEAQQWEGWGTALKPAWEPIIVARKPLAGTVAQNVLTHGTGALNIDACRVDGRERTDYGLSTAARTKVSTYGQPSPSADFDSSKGRWPTNVVLDESQAAELDAQSGITKSTGGKGEKSGKLAQNVYGDYAGTTKGANAGGLGDTGGASRFFPTFKYQAKAPAKERPRVNGVAHPTVKPLALMRWLVKLVTPPDGWVLDPFAGSGTTGEAAIAEGMRCVLIERETEYLPLIAMRLGVEVVADEPASQSA